MYNESHELSVEDLVDQYQPLVRRIAHHLLVRMPASVCVDDLLQAGVIGLIEAAKKYDLSKGASFETYAGIRIRGAMLDEMRRGDWAPRSVHRNARLIADAFKAVEQRIGRDARDDEVAAELELSLEDYHSMAQDTMASRLFSLNDVLSLGEGGDEVLAGEEANPIDNVTEATLKKGIAKAITQLPDREQLVLSLYYDEELNLREIGEVLGVSESRVSQIHSQAAMRLRSKLAQWLDAD